MALYGRQPDMGRHLGTQAESGRRVRTRRPLNDQVPIVGWHIEGEIVEGRELGPYLLRIDEDHPEHKELTGFNAWLLSGGPVTVRWSTNVFSALVEAHEISSSTPNEVLLDEPFVIGNGDLGGEFIRPVITGVTGTPTGPLCLYMYVRTVPI